MNVGENSYTAFEGRSDFLQYLLIFFVPGRPPELLYSLVDVSLG